MGQGYLGEVGAHAVGDGFVALLVGFIAAWAAGFAAGLAQHGELTEA